MRRVFGIELACAASILASALRSLKFAPEIRMCSSVASAPSARRSTCWTVRPGSTYLRVQTTCRMFPSSGRICSGLALRWRAWRRSSLLRCGAQLRWQRRMKSWTASTQTGRLELARCVRLCPVHSAPATHVIRSCSVRREISDTRKRASANWRGPFPATPRLDCWLRPCELWWRCTSIVTSAVCRRCETPLRRCSKNAARELKSSIPSSRPRFSCLSAATGPWSRCETRPLASWQAVHSCSRMRIPMLVVGIFIATDS